MIAAEWRNWSGSVVCRPREILHASREDEICDLVRRASRNGNRVRAVGSGHSFTPLCACDDALVSLDALAGIESVDVANRQAVVWAGTKIHALGDPLFEHGLALANQGDIDRQSLAGAVATGTHGTGPQLGGLSTQVAALRLVDGQGNLRDVDADDVDGALCAAALSLGALGIVTRITLQLRPAYRLRERQWREPIEDCLTRLPERIAATRHFEFFWYPATDLAHCKSLDPLKDSSDAATLAAGERIDHSFRVFPSQRDNRFNEMEYSVPAARGPDCFRAIRDLMRGRFREVVWPVEYRTVAADRLDLSPAFDRATVAISLHEAADRPCAEFFAAAEPILRAAKGRPHWGKMHGLVASELAGLYPEWGHFQQTRRRFDPQGRFSSPYLERLLGPLRP